MSPALFLDRDGILNRMVYDENHGVLDSPRRPEQVRLVPGAAALIKAARAGSLPVVVVTNQPGIAKGTLTTQDLDAVNRRLADLLREEGAAWDAIYVCPHHPQGDGHDGAAVQDCECRKPKPGMLLLAARELGIDLRRSWMVGDGFTDVQAGRAAGCHTMLVANVKVEHVEAMMSLPNARPDVHCGSVAEAAQELCRRLQST